MTLETFLLVSLQQKDSGTIWQNCFFVSLTTLAYLTTRHVIFRFGSLSLSRTSSIVAVDDRLKSVEDHRESASQSLVIFHHHFAFFTCQVGLHLIARDPFSLGK